MELTTEQLDEKIGKHLKRRKRLERMMEQIVKRVDYRDRQIRELSAKRTITLNMKLPFDHEPAGDRAALPEATGSIQSSVGDAESGHAEDYRPPGGSDTPVETATLSHATQ